MTNPEPPREGALIEAARADARLSVREAARRTGISEGWWRQIVKGSQSLSGGGHGTVRGPAETVAKMARVVGVQPCQLTAAGREDAARALDEILRREAVARSASAPSATEDGQFSLFKQLPRTLVDQIWPDYLLIAGRAEAAAAAHEGLVPAGAQVFPRDAALAAQWDDLAVQVQGLGVFPGDEALIHRIAETMALAWTVARGRQAGGGSSPVAAGLGGRRRPVIHALRFRER